MCDVTIKMTLHGSLLPYHLRGECPGYIVIKAINTKATSTTASNCLQCKLGVRASNSVVGPFAPSGVCTVRNIAVVGVFEGVDVERCFLKQVSASDR
jgi:hypothetical protein